MYIPRGKEVIILVGGKNVLDQPEIANGLKLTLEEDLNLQLSSQFEPIYSGGGNLAVDIAGTLARDKFGLGFSSQFKQFGFQVWKKTEPVRFTINLRFFMGKSGADFSGRTEVQNPMYSLMNLTLPSEGGGFGSLITPGPSVLDLFGEGGNTTSSGRTISINIGQMIRFPKVIVRSAQPTFSNIPDSEGYPSEGRLNLEIETLFNATTDLFKLQSGSPTNRTI